MGANSLQHHQGRSSWRFQKHLRNEKTTPQLESGDRGEQKLAHPKRISGNDSRQKEERHFCKKRSRQTLKMPFGKNQK